MANAFEHNTYEQLLGKFIANSFWRSFSQIQTRVTNHFPRFFIFFCQRAVESFLPTLYIPAQFDYIFIQFLDTERIVSTDFH